MKLSILKRIVEKINANISEYNISDSQLDEDLLNFGLDSITFIKIIVSLEEEFDCEIPDEKLLIKEMNTLRKIYDVISTLSINNYTNPDE